MRSTWLVLSLLTLLQPLNSLASADCVEHPQSEWIPEETLKKTMLDEGYTIRKFKVDGNCYEIYGLNPAGKRIEFYFDTKTLAIVKAEVEK